MKKIIVLIFLLSSLCVSTAYSQSFILVEIIEDLPMVLIRDQDSGREWFAEKGDVIQGWTIEDITQNHVTMSTLRDDGTLLMAQLHAPPVIHPIRQGH